MLALRLLRIVWFIRILRVLKIARHTSPVCSRQLSGSMLSQVFNSSALAILAVLSFLIVVSASLLYLVESDRCEERGIPCNGFESIPASFWFSTITLTTVGYGDVYPFTPTGRAIAAFLAVCAVILLSLSTALLSNNLTESRTTEELDAKEQEMLQDMRKVPWSDFHLPMDLQREATRLLKKYTWNQKNIKFEAFWWKRWLIAIFFYIFWDRSLSRVFLSFTIQGLGQIGTCSRCCVRELLHPASSSFACSTHLAIAGGQGQVAEGDSCVEIVCLNGFPGLAGLTKQDSKMKYDFLFFDCQKTSMQVSLFRNARMPQLDASAPMSFDTVDTEKWRGLKVTDAEKVRATATDWTDWIFGCQVPDSEKSPQDVVIFVQCPSL